MLEIVVVYLFGLAVIFLGVLAFKGNVKYLHSYHVKRVSEENKKPFCLLVGIGHTIIGLFVIIANVFTTVAYVKGGSDTLTTISTVIALAGLVIGIAICFYAMIKYNKGIF